jgi:hypothetical protein
MNDELSDIVNYFASNGDTRSIEGVNTLIQKIKTESNGDREKTDFYLEELIVALGLMAYMGTKYNRYDYILAEGFQNAIIDLEAGLINKASLENSLITFGDIFAGTVFTQNQEDALYYGLKSSIDRGLTVNFAGKATIDTASIQTVLDNAVTNAHYYSSTSFYRLIKPRVMNAVENLINKPDKAAHYLDIRETIYNF